MIRFDQNKRPHGIWHSPELRLAFKVVEDVFSGYSQDVPRGSNHDIWITCGPEGEHSAGSRHGCGDAVDIRSKWHEESKRQEIAHAVQAELNRVFGPGVFDFLFEKDHHHLEFNRILELRG